MSIALSRRSVDPVGCSFAKRFALPFREGGSVEIHAEGFNVLNKTNFGAPNGDRSSNAFGTIRSTFPARQLQLAGKINF